MGRFRIMDVHAVVGRGDEEDPVRTGCSGDLLLQIMAEAGVERAVICPPPVSVTFRDANDAIRAAVARHPDRFLGLLRVKSAERHPLRWRDRISGRSRRPGPTSTADEIRDALRRPEFAGVKIHLADDGMPAPQLWRTIREEARLVLLHGGLGVDYDYLEERVLRRFSVPIVLAHGGGYPLCRRLFSRAIGMAEAYPHVYLDTSFVIFRAVLQEMADRIPDKLIFGSDAPSVHPAVVVETVCRIQAPESVLQGILYDNLDRLLSASRGGSGPKPPG